MLRQLRAKCKRGYVSGIRRSAAPFERLPIGRPHVRIGNRFALFTPAPSFEKTKAGSHDSCRCGQVNRWRTVRALYWRSIGASVARALYWPSSNWHSSSTADCCARNKAADRGAPIARNWAKPLAIGADAIALAVCAPADVSSRRPSAARTRANRRAGTDTSRRIQIDILRAPMRH